MTTLARAAGFAAAFMLSAARRIEAQTSSIRVTIAEFRGETKDGVRMDGSVDCRKR